MLRLTNLIGFGAGGGQKPVGIPGPYQAPAVTFDGSNDNLQRDTDLTGNADSKLLLLSFWFRRSANGFKLVLQSIPGTGGGQVFFHTDNAIRLLYDNDGATNILDTTTAPVVTDTVWHQYAACIDMADSAKRHVLLDGAEQSPTWATYTNDVIDFTHTDHAIGATVTNGSKFSGDLADLWWGPGQYLDLSVAANLAKFRDAGGKPVNLGSDGSLPTGTAPLVFFTGDAAVWNAGTNSGSGGDYAMSGAVADAASSPSD